MTKATFTGYFPKLKAHREATVKSGKAINPKGSIRYQIKGECMDDEKGLCISLPKMVTREDFENVYGFDAKEAESAIILGDDKEGNPVGYIHVVGYEDKRGVTPTEIHTGTSGISPKEMAKALGGTYDADTVGSPSPADVEPPAPSEKPFPQEPSNENFSAEVTAQPVMWDEYGLEGDNDGRAYGIHFTDGHEVYDVHWFATAKERDAEIAKYNETEVKEAFGLFGDKDEEEAEPEEPKTQEFTVVLQEGDKLELTDVEETADTKDEDEGADEENDEKAADTWRGLKTDKAPSFRHKETGEVRDYNTMMKIGMESSYDEIIKMNQEWEAIDADGNVVEFEAVQAKVTRPVKEDETEDEEEEEESEEGMSTLTKVGLGVGALAIGAAILGAEDEGELDYWDGENAEWRAEGEGEVDFGTQTPKRQIDAWIRHDHNWADYNWRTDGDLSEDETYTVKELVEETIVEDDDEDRGEGPYESTFTYNDDSGKDRDVDIEWHKWRDDGRYYGRAAEGEDFQKMTPSEFVPFDQMQEELGQMWDETTAPLADAHNYDYEPSNEPSNSNFSAEFEARTKRKSYYDPLTDTSHYDKKGKLLITPDGMHQTHNRHSGERKDRDKLKTHDLSKDLRRKGIPLKVKPSEKQEGKEFYGDTVGSPSPSGPSSVPEPAEATGSEPSNEHMEADSKTKNMVLGTVALGIGLSVILGKDRINKMFDRFGL